MGETPILYFDRCVGTDIPESLRRLGMRNVYHHHIKREIVGERPKGPDGLTLFRHDTPDDEWMEYVGAKNWIVISQDYRFQTEPATLSAIKQHGVRVFYLWGSQAPKSESMRVFLNARQRILDVATKHNGPYIFRVLKNASLKRFM